MGSSGDSSVSKLECPLRIIRNLGDWGKATRVVLCAIRPHSLGVIPADDLLSTRAPSKIQTDADVPANVYWVPRITANETIQFRRNATIDVTRTQFPVAPAWPITANLSQSASLAKVVVDFSSPYQSAGQVYVALSRCDCTKTLFVVPALRPRDRHATTTNRDSRKLVLNPINRLVLQR